MTEFNHNSNSNVFFTDIKQLMENKDKISPT
jgi:hypothetical protein